MLPNFQDIYYFVETVEAASISRASERIGITQPSLSLAIKRLEDTLRTKLLIRNKNGIQPTKAGLQFHKKGRAILHEWQGILGEISASHNDVSGHYVIGCHSSVALYALPKLLPELMNKYPGLHIKLNHQLSRLITDAVIDYKVDIGIVVNPVLHPDLVVKELCKDLVQLWTSSKPSEVQSLTSENKVLVCDPKLIQVQTIIKQLKKRKIHFHRLIDSSSLEVISAMTAGGAGIGVIPSRVALIHQAKKLKPIGKSMPTYKDRICLIYRKDFQVTRASKIIVEAIKQNVIF